MSARGADPIERLRLELGDALRAQDWKKASGLTDRLRMRHGWKYATFVAEFGERWEERSEEMDNADSEGDS